VGFPERGTRHVRQPAIIAPERTSQAVPFAIRSLVSDADLLACVALQRRTWGEEFGEVVPSSILRISQRLGGVVAGAFDPHGHLIGFVFGMTGVERGEIVHWSDMLAVAPEARNRGIGRRLKEHQRSEVAKVGAKFIYWTFDPLVARNAHLNLNVFGVRVSEYVDDMYGASSSPLHRGIGTDRLIVKWAVDDGELATRRQEIADMSRNGGASVVRIEIPSDIEELQSSDAAAARGWRSKTREEFHRLLGDGYRVHSFQIDRDARRGRYVLAR
jgi:predicted GNAT superfamily acetyltransferase